ncbi:hypothetical protein ACIBBG_32340 [Micromonospora chersina]|uniref:hypothetical protein n=1 Tax=Micromonospora chersina TaxID=47854 RepID=UPI0037AFF2CA
MTWLAWRQQRLTWLIVAIVFTAVLSVSAYGHWRVANLIQQADVFKASEGYNDIFTDSQLVAILIPPLVGIFLGVSLFAPEIEHNTHVLVLTQSVSRLRWFFVKIAYAAVAAVAAGGLQSIAFDWSWSQYIAALDQSWVDPMTLGARGVDPAAYTLLATVAGAAAGLLIRRTLSAVAITIGVFAVVRVGGMFAWLSLVPTRQDVRQLPGAYPAPPRDSFAFFVDGGFILNDGQRLLNYDPVYQDIIGSCPVDTVADKCLVENGVAAEFIRYYSTDQFAAIQAVDAGLAIAISFILLAIGAFWVRKRTH